MSNSAGDGQAKGNQDQHVDRQERLPFETEIEFIGDFDVLQAKGINISEGGLAFEVDGGLPFEMRFKVDGQDTDYQAELVWMKRMPNGGYRMGFRFVGPGDQPVI